MQSVRPLRPRENPTAAEQLDAVYAELLAASALAALNVSRGVSRDTAMVARNVLRLSIRLTGLLCDTYPEMPLRSALAVYLDDRDWRQGLGPECSVLDREATVVGPEIDGVRCPTCHERVAWQSSARLGSLVALCCGATFHTLTTVHVVWRSEVAAADDDRRVVSLETREEEPCTTA